MVCAIGGLPKCAKFTCSGDTFGGCWLLLILMMFHYKSMVSWSYNHCHIHQWCLLWGVFSNVPNSRQFIICLYLGNLNKILLPINTASLSKVSTISTVATVSSPQSIQSIQSIQVNLSNLKVYYSSIFVYSLHSSQVMLWGLSRAVGLPCFFQGPYFQNGTGCSV